MWTDESVKAVSFFKTSQLPARKCIKLIRIMHSLAAKIISLTSLFTLTFIAGVIPLRLRRNDQNGANLSKDLRRKQLISLSTCFAGGAFFASSMLELLPMVEREFAAVLKEAKIKTDFPVSEFGISVGFFLILILEQIIHVMKDKSEKHPTKHSSLKTAKRNGSFVDASFHVQKEGQNIIERDSGESDYDDDHDHHHDHDHDHEHGVGHHNPHHNHGNNIEASDHHHDHSMMFVNTNTKHQNQRHYLRSYLLLTALSIHALFEGLAVGLFQNVDSMVELLGALIIHKSILAFSIGINLVQHSFPPSMIIKSALLFSMMSPVGLGFGILLLKYTSATLGHIFSAIFQAIATGTFLYVTFFEIFFHELNSKECHKLLKVLLMILGFSLITVVQYFDTKISTN